MWLAGFVDVGFSCSEWPHFASCFSQHSSPRTPKNRASWQSSRPGWSRCWRKKPRWRNRSKTWETNAKHTLRLVRCASLSQVFTSCASIFLMSWCCCTFVHHNSTFASIEAQKYWCLFVTQHRIRSFGQVIFVSIQNRKEGTKIRQFLTMSLHQRQNMWRMIVADVMSSRYLHRESFNMGWSQFRALIRQNYHAWPFNVSLDNRWRSGGLLNFQLRKMMFCLLGIADSAWWQPQEREFRKSEPRGKTAAARGRSC